MPLPSKARIRKIPRCPTRILFDERRCSSEAASDFLTRADFSCAWHSILKIFRRYGLTFSPFSFIIYIVMIVLDEEEICQR